MEFEFIRLYFGIPKLSARPFPLSFEYITLLSYFKCKDILFIWEELHYNWMLEVQNDFVF